jgi:hypothetical protein
MHEVYLSSLSDTLLVAIPFVAVVALAIFRLDSLFARSKRPREPKNYRRPGCGMDVNGGPLLVDPDGRPSGSLSRGK